LQPKGLQPCEHRIVTEGAVSRLEPICIFLPIGMSIKKRRQRLDVDRSGVECAGMSEIVQGVEF
jgi:hypothetical protein